MEHNFLFFYRQMLFVYITVDRNSSFAENIQNWNILYI